MEHILHTIASLNGTTVRVETASWNKGLSKFPQVSRELSYVKNDGWTINIRYNVKVADFSDSNLYSIAIQLTSKGVKLPNFKIRYRNRLNRIFWKRKSTFMVYSRSRSVRKKLYVNDEFCRYYDEIDATVSDVEPFMHGTTSKGDFVCQLSFYSNSVPEKEFLKSLRLLECLQYSFEKYTV